MTDITNRRDPFPAKIMEELRTNLLRVQTSASASRIWERVLTQDDRRGLGGEIEQAYERGRTIGMWMEVRGVSQPRAIIELAFELDFITKNTKQWLLREIGELYDSIEETIAAAVESEALVLLEQTREVFWRGERIDVAWHDRPAMWNFLWVLCEHAKSGAGVDHTHFAEGVQLVYPAKTKSKLCNLDNFPQDLGFLITSEGRGTQRLDLPPSSIHLFAVRTVEILHEVTG